MSVQSVDRALEILGLFSPATPKLGITQISRSTKLAKGTVHGLVRTLMKHGFVTQDPETKKYSLGLAIHEMGAILAVTLKINRMGGTTAQNLAHSTSLMTRLGIWDNDSVLITANLFAENHNVQFNNLGPRVPAYCSALGKAMLSAMSQKEQDQYIDKTPLVSFTSQTMSTPNKLKKDLAAAKSRGYAMDVEEFTLGLCCLAAPIFDSTNRPVAAISASGSSRRVFGKHKDQYIRELLRAAKQISQYMGCLTYPPA